MPDYGYGIRQAGEKIAGGLEVGLANRRQNQLLAIQTQQQKIQDIKLEKEKARKDIFTKKWGQAEHILEIVQNSKYSDVMRKHAYDQYTPLAEELGMYVPIFENWDDDLQNWLKDAKASKEDFDKGVKTWQEHQQSLKTAAELHQIKSGVPHERSKIQEVLDYRMKQGRQVEKTVQLGEQQISGYVRPELGTEITPYTYQGQPAISTAEQRTKPTKMGAPPMLSPLQTRLNDLQQQEATLIKRGKDIVQEDKPWFGRNVETPEWKQYKVDLETLRTKQQELGSNIDKLIEKGLGGKKETKESIRELYRSGDITIDEAKKRIKALGE